MSRAGVQSTEVHHEDSTGLVAISLLDLILHVAPLRAWKFAKYTGYWRLLRFVLDVDEKYHGDTVRMAHESL